MELRPIKTKKVYEEIVEQVKFLIINGHLKPGDRLPSERHLVDSFRVSRSSIREALSALEMMGVVEVRTGEGAYIRKLEANTLVDSLTWVLSMDKGSMLELFEIKHMIEVQAAGFAAERINDDELQELARILHSMTDKNCIWEKADRDFHYEIVRATHNKSTIRLMDTISGHFQHLIYFSNPKRLDFMYVPDFIYKEHSNIYEALKTRDSEGARSSMLQHLKGMEEVIINNLISGNVGLS